MGFGVDGLVSGMNTGAMVDAMVSVYSLPQRALEQQIVDTEAKKQAIAGVMNRLDKMDDAIEAIEDEGDFKVYKAAYEETDAFKVTTEDGAIAGSYTIQVNALATTELEITEGFEDKSSTGVIAEGELSIKYAGVESTITVDSSNSSLSDLAAAIDDIDGLSAYVLNTGADTEPYRLVVQGEDTGSDNIIAFNTSGLTGSGTAPSFTEQRAAADAEIEINGITVVDADNEFSDSVPGLDIEVYQTTSSAENVTVSLDKSKIKANLQGIVSAYNEVVKFVASKSVHSTELGITGPLVGETAATRVLRNIQSVVSDEYSTGDTLNSLSLMGIETQSDGTLAIESDDLDDALDDYLDDVVAMFTTEDAGFSGAMREQIDVYTDSVDGTLESFKDSLDSRVRDLEKSVSDYDYRILRYEERLRNQFSSMESLLGSMQGTSSYMSAYLGSSQK